MCLKSIVLFSTQDEFYAILAIQKLFSLGFKPCNIVLVRCESSVFVQNFVKMYGITLYIYKTHRELEKFLKTEVKITKCLDILGFSFHFLFLMQKQHSSKK